MTGVIFDIKELAVHDGPGIRTTVFFKGCPLRCRWCHNPEGLSSRPQLMLRESRCRHCGRCLLPCTHEDCRPFGRCLHICPENCLNITGRQVTAAALARELTEGADVLGSAFGGITFSGGEPLMQPEFLLGTAKRLPGFHLCMETSGYAKVDVFERVISALDLIIMDIKLADSELHRQYTGVPNEAILANFELLRDSGKPYLIRTPLVPGITDTAENLEQIRRLIGDSRWEQLPFNEMAGAKYRMLGMAFPLAEQPE